MKEVMMKYGVKIVEMTQKFIEVDANDKRDALLVAARMYVAGDIEMAGSDKCRTSAKVFGTDGNPNMLDLGTLRYGVR